MGCFTKNRNEQDLYEISFEERLGVGETVTTTDVRVERAVAYEWEDATSELLSTEDVAEVGGVVQFRLRAAASPTEQSVGTYRVIATAGTSHARTLLGVIELQISA